MLSKLVGDVFQLILSCILLQIDTIWSSSYFLKEKIGVVGCKSELEQSLPAAGHAPQAAGRAPHRVESLHAAGWLIGARSPPAASRAPATATHQNLATAVKERKEFC
jgi:hypothetical protein